MNIIEGFRWFREDLHPMDRNGGKLIIKGKAIIPTISRNNRQYIEKELQAAARTLTNVPMDVNHEYDVWEDQRRYHEEQYGEGSFNVKPPKFKGNVIAGEYEDGAVEYVAQITDKTYVEKLIDRRDMTLEQYREKWGVDPIYGVSISASFRYPDEGEEILTPIGIVFERLSLVEDPERPGIVGTTIRVLETEGENHVKGETDIIGLLIEKTVPRLLEEYYNTVDDSLREMNTMSEKHEIGIASVDTLNPQNKHLKEALLREIDEPHEEAAEAAHLDKDDEDEEEESSEKLHDDKDDEEETSEADIGEPFAGFDDHSACVAANGDKEDPDAFCAHLKRRAGGETWEDIGEVTETIKEAVDIIIESLYGEHTHDDGTPLGEHTHDEDLEQPIEVEEVDSVEFEEVSEILKVELDTSVEDQKRLIEVKADQKRQTEINKRMSVAVKTVDGNLKLLHEMVKTSVGADRENISELGTKLTDSRKQLKSLQEKLEDKAGVDKVARIKETLDKQVSGLENVKKSLKDGDGTMLQIVETVSSFSELMDSYNDVVDDYKDKQVSSDDRIQKLEVKLVEVENKDYTSELEEKLDKHSEKLSTLETKDYTSELQSQIDTHKTDVETRLTEIETKDYTSELEAKLESQKLEYDDKLKEISEKDYTSALETKITELETKLKLVDGLAEKVESLEAGLSGEFKSTETEVAPQEKEGDNLIPNPAYPNAG